MTTVLPLGEKSGGYLGEDREIGKGWLQSLDDDGHLTMDLVGLRTHLHRRLTLGINTNFQNIFVIMCSLSSSHAHIA